MEQAKQDRSRVLIVDDQESIRRLLVDVLAGSGQNIELLQASDGVEAQAVIQRGGVDIVITDLLMPRMGGLELMQWGQQEHREITWIILSGQGTFNDAVKAIQLGAFDFITKPQDLVNSVRVTVRNALRQRALAAEREQLTRDLADRNEQLTAKVRQLEEACGLLCEQARTIGQDLRRAELIQRAMLPRAAPPMDGFAIDAVYRPSHNVGGDLYDAIRLGESHLALYIADAAGHGVAAAMLAVLFKHRLALLDASGRPRPPAEVLAEVNESLRTECRAPGLFVTAAYCLLDLASRELTVASAGHPPLLLRRAGGDIEMVYHTGPALGLAPGGQFAQKRFTLGPRDRLLMYTDGMYETESVGVDYWEMARLLKAASGCGQAFLHRLLDESAKRRGELGQEDDITLFMLTASPVPSTLDNEAGPPPSVPAAQAVPLSSRGEVLLGRDGERTYVSVQGNGNWSYCSHFYDACYDELCEHRTVRLDLSLCMHLDSTFLGTVQELTAQADRLSGRLEIQGPLPHVRRLFEELGMESVLKAIQDQMLPLPSEMTPLTSRGHDDEDRQRILLAHEALAALNEKNRKEFIRLIEGMRRELQRVGH